MIVLKDEKIADIKQLAEKLGEKRLSFANDEELMRLLQVVPGVTVGFHPFVNTTTLNIAYSDFLRFLEKADHEALRLDC